MMRSDASLKGKIKALAKKSNLKLFSSIAL